MSSGDYQFEKSVKVAILGAGKMGSILLQSFLRDGLLNAGADLGDGGASGAGAGAEGEVEGARRDRQPRGGEEAGHYFSVREAAGGGRGGAGDSRDTCGEKQLMISVAASVPTDMIERGAGKRGAGGARDAEYSVRAGRGHDGAVQGEVCAEAASGNGDEVFRRRWGGR